MPHDKAKIWWCRLLFIFLLDAHLFPPELGFSFFNVMNSLFEVSIIRSLSSLELIFCLPSAQRFYTPSFDYTTTSSLIVDMPSKNLIIAAKARNSESERAWSKKSSSFTIIYYTETEYTTCYFCAIGPRVFGSKSILKFIVISTNTLAASTAKRSKAEMKF